MLKTAVGGIAEIINAPGHVNVYFEDVSIILGQPGRAMMGTAVASGPGRAGMAAEAAVASPMLEGVELSDAKGVLVIITSAKGNLKLSESKLALNTVRAITAPDAYLSYATTFDNRLNDEIRVTVVATGLMPVGGLKGVRSKYPPAKPGVYLF